MKRGPSQIAALKAELATVRLLNSELEKLNTRLRSDLLVRDSVCQILAGAVVEKHGEGCECDTCSLARFYIFDDDDEAEAKN